MLRQIVLVSSYHSCSHKVQNFLCCWEQHLSMSLCLCNLRPFFFPSLLRHSLHTLLHVFLMIESILGFLCKQNYSLALYRALLDMSLTIISNSIDFRFLYWNLIITSISQGSNYSEFWAYSTSSVNVTPKLQGRLENPLLTLNLGLKSVLFTS